MANKIRGLTIQINGETKGLNKALSEVNSQSKSLQKELKEVEKALKLNPGNTELLRQRQTLLAQSVETTRTKLDALRQAQEKMANANAANARWEEAYQPLKAQIDETKEALRKLAAQEETMRSKLESGEISTEQYEIFQRTLQETTQKSKDLAKQAKDLEKQFADGHISDEEYRRFQRELTNTTRELRNLENQASRSDVALTRISDTCSKVGDKLTSAGKKMTMGVTGPLAAAGAAAFKLASDFDESLNKVKVAFGDNSAVVEEFAKTTLKSFGIAEGSALEMASLFGDMGTSMGLSTREAAGMSNSLVGLAGDLSSFKNIKLDVAQTALSGIFTGETESLKKLGIVMTEVNLQEYARSQGIKTKIQDMSQSEKVQLRYNYILEMTKNAHGDFTRTSEGAANSMRVMQETVKEAGANFGKELLPILTPIIQELTRLLEGFNALDQGTKNFIVRSLVLVATLGPVLIMVGAVFKAIGSIAGGIGALGEVAGTFTKGAGNATYATFVKWAGIIALVTLAVTALAVAIGVLMGRGDQLSNTFNSIGKTLAGTGTGSLGKIPAHAKGTNFHPGGLALVGEQGAELVSLPRGTRVYNNGDTRKILSDGGGSGGDNFYVTVNVESLEDIEKLKRIARDARRLERMGTVKG